MPTGGDVPIAKDIAATDHHTNQCKAKATPRNTGTGGNLNTIIPTDQFDEINHLNDPSQS
jgi:hypothetical protein